MVISKSRLIGDTTLVGETGKLAKQAHGSCVVTLGETQVLATCTTAEPREGIDFFPLTVDVEERMYAAGKIPGGFFRREGRPSETAILTARLTDRPLRPTFRDGYRDEVQVVITVLSVDQANPYDIPGINAASLAVMLAGLPFDGPIGAVRLGLIGGQWKVNPTYQDLDLATFDVVVAGRMNDQGSIDILMVEGEAPEGSWERILEGATMPTEEVVAEGLEFAKGPIGEIIELQRQIVADAGTKPKEFVPAPAYAEDLYRAVEEFAGPRLKEALVHAKAEREANLDALKDELKEHLAASFGEEYAAMATQVSPAFKELQKKAMRRRIIEEGIRLDGRKPDEIRPITCEVGLVPRAHGSGLFQRGETQVLNVITLGMLRMTQMIDTLDPEDSKRYIHHYNFPPFSTGEVGRIGSPKRRDIGHGALAERALVPVVPSEDEFPYTLRLVSDVLESNGSTSMASVCASTLSHMDAGVPIKAPVGGIAMGLVAELGEFVTLTDILGAEDALGDMDFKVAGTKDFVTALQLDTKVTGLPAEVLAGALKQAKDARLAILDVMTRTISEPRSQLSLKAPRVIMKQIPVDKIGEVIGPKGKRINEIIALTGADIDIEDDGRVFIGSRDGESAERAVDMIEQIVHPRLPQAGERFEGTVVKTTDFGAFVNIMPGTDGLVHISKLGRGRRLQSVEEAVKQGDKLTVEVESVEPDRNRIALKPVGEGWDPPEGGWPRQEGEGERRPRPDGENRGRGFRPRRDRDRDRGDRGTRREH
ncbi:MAG: polyribonucleotide nucleotidyltransferase [Actinobacteria bacterium]|nr:MAG: polyribonucleotide nucleotidyltransferase [Actinomycetota bacterium]